MSHSGVDGLVAPRQGWFWDVQRWCYNRWPLRHHHDTGLFLAQGLAIIALVALHLVPPVLYVNTALQRTFSWEWPDSIAGQQYAGLSWAAELLPGRVEALLIVLLGAFLARTHLTHGADNSAIGHITVRHLAIIGVTLIIIGAALQFVANTTPLLLSTYGAALLTAIPLRRLAPAWLGTLTVLGIVALPLMSFFIRDQAGLNPGRDTPISTLAEPGTWIVDLVLTGQYPLLTYLPMVWCGLYLGRINLSRKPWQVLLMVVGAIITAVGILYRAATNTSIVFGNAQQPLSNSGYAHADDLMGHLIARSPLGTYDVTWWTLGFPGTVPTHDVSWLTVGHPYSGTPLDILFCLGTAVFIVAWLQSASHFFQDTAKPLALPFMAVASMSLTWYVLHALTLNDAIARPWNSTTQQLIADYAVQALVLLAVSTAWIATRNTPGPLEQLLARITGWPKRTGDPAPSTATGTSPGTTPKPPHRFEAP